jgi:hypothetical protein
MNGLTGRGRCLLSTEPACFERAFIAFPKICENALLAVHFIKMFNLKVETKSGFKIIEN